MSFRSIVSAAALIALPALLLARPAAAVPMDTVVLQGLDKITARVSTIKVPVGQTVTFGALQITARACDKHPPEEAPEAAAFLEVVEVEPDEKPVLRFSGWMFASSPALSALEHPVYDLVVLDCVNANGTPAEDVAPNPDQDQQAPAAGDKSKPADQSKQPAPAPAQQ
ncbi:MAG TPA: DUF2155 domain-containing protein [Dongiaceae bacterium]|jgi:hypothetical protein|nr:DUF2155 domain-containing protein [Dongiaceae bacterium]